MTRTPEQIQVDISAALDDVEATGYYTRLADLYGELHESVIGKVPLWAATSTTFARQYFAEKAARDAELESQRAPAGTT